MGGRRRPEMWVYRSRSRTPSGNVLDDVYLHEYRERVGDWIDSVDEVDYRAWRRMTGIALRPGQAVRVQITAIGPVESVKRGQ